MQFSLDLNPGKYHIHAYGPGEITVTIPSRRRNANDTPDTIADPEKEVAQIQRETLHKSLIISPEQLIRDWPPQTVGELNAAHLELLLSLQPEIVLFGSGARTHHPDPAVMACLVNAGIGIEVMDTGAACRTFGILSSDGRNVVAALMMI